MMVLRHNAKYSVWRFSLQYRSIYTPRRALLYVPGDDERKLNKIPSIKADCVVMDCEDGVAYNRKKAARETIFKVLQDKSINFGNSECCIRINSPQLMEIATEDIKCISELEKLPSTLVLPKLDTVEEVKWFYDEILKHRKSSHEAFKLITMVETAHGLLNLRDVCQELLNLSKSNVFAHEAIIFGSDDFCADIGATRSKEGSELYTARQMSVIIAKAFRLQIIDLVHIDYKDLEGLKKFSEEGFQFGFTGKQVIHPSQVPIVHRAYTPSREKIEWATELIKCFEEHQASGKGAFTFRGSMIDKPLLLQAQNIVEMHDQLLRVSPN